jgi:hypothetical protein
VLAPDGRIVSVFGDTFSGKRVGRGDWRSPVVLIGTGDAHNAIIYERAGGPDPHYARQLWDYGHDDAHSGWSRGGIGTVIPSDLLRNARAISVHSRRRLQEPMTAALNAHSTDGDVGTSAG